MLGGPVQTGLELTTEGREPGVVARVGVEERVAAVVIALGGSLAAVDVGARRGDGGLHRGKLLVGRGRVVFGSHCDVPFSLFLLLFPFPPRLQKQ